MHNLPHSRKTLKVLSASAVLLIFINCMLFTYYNANPLIKSDGWRFLNIYLIPWLNNELHWTSLWQDHHPQPLTATLFLINANYFGLRMDYEALLAASFTLFTAALIWRIISRTSSELAYNQYLFIIIATALLCSLSSTAVYSWSLVTLGHIFIFFAFVTLSAIDNIKSTNTMYIKIPLYSIAVSLLFILFLDGAKIIIYSSIIILLLSFIIDRNTKWLIPISTIVFAIILQRIFFQMVGFQTGYSETQAVSLISDKIQHIPEYLLYMGVGLLSAWANIDALITQTKINHVFIYVIGSVVFATYLYTLFLFYREKIYTTTIIPGILILSSLLTGAGASMFRFKPDVQAAISANVPRYYLLYVLGAIGVIWTWSMLINLSKSDNRIKSMYLTIVSLTLVSQLASSIIAWNSTVYRIKAYNNAHQIMLRNADGDTTVKPPRFMTGSNYPEPYLNGLKVLKENRLNMFSEQNIMAKFRNESP